MQAVRQAVGQAGRQAAAQPLSERPKMYKVMEPCLHHADRTSWHVCFYMIPPLSTKL
jgi:hypothetical protein